MLKIPCASRPGDTVMRSDWPSVGDANFGIFSSPAIAMAGADSQCLNNGIAFTNGWAGATILRDPHVADAIAAGLFIELFELGIDGAEHFDIHGGFVGARQPIAHGIDARFAVAAVL